MSYLRKLSSAEVSISSMADIAFLLLTFFLTTTVIDNHKGIIMMLPTWSEIPPVSDVNNRNLFKIHINSDDNYLIEDAVRRDLAGVRKDIKKFILNNTRASNLSENPLKAIVSLKADRGTSHKAFIAALDEIQGAYYEIYAARVGITSKEFRQLDLNKPYDRKIYDKAREGFPMNISIAEPSGK